MGMRRKINVMMTRMMTRTRMMMRMMTRMMVRTTMIWMRNPH